MITHYQQQLICYRLSLSIDSIESIEEWANVFFIRFKKGKPRFVSKKAAQYPKIKRIAEANPEELINTIYASAPEIKKGFSQRDYRYLIGLKKELEIVDFSAQRFPILKALLAIHVGLNQKCNFLPEGQKLKKAVFTPEKIYEQNILAFTDELIEELLTNIVAQTKAIFKAFGVNKQLATLAKFEENVNPYYGWVDNNTAYLFWGNVNIAICSPSTALRPEIPLTLKEKAEECYAV